MPRAGTEVVFSYDAVSHVLSIAAAEEPDVEWAGRDDPVDPAGRPARAHNTSVSWLRRATPTAASA